MATTIAARVIPTCHPRPRAARSAASAFRSAMSFASVVRSLQYSACMVFMRSANRAIRSDSPWGAGHRTNGASPREGPNSAGRSARSPHRALALGIGEGYPQALGEPPGHSSCNGPSTRSTCHRGSVRPFSFPASSRRSHVGGLQSISMATAGMRRAQGASTTFGAAARPAPISAKARAPSDSGRISVQSRVPRRPSKIAAAASQKSAALYV